VNTKNLSKVREDQLRQFRLALRGAREPRSRKTPPKSRVLASQSKVAQQGNVTVLRMSQSQVVARAADGITGVLQLVSHRRIGKTVAIAAKRGGVLADPKKIKAEIRIARDAGQGHSLGQKATIDTRNGRL